MIHVFFRGIILGLGLAILFIGPSLFALIQASIKNGFKSAAVMAFGISLSDVLLVSLSYLGASQLLDNPKNVEYMRIIGSLILFGFGIYTLAQKHDKEDAKSAKVVVPDSKHLPIMFVKGFFLNLFNPSVFFFWITCVGTVSSNYTSRQEAIVFFAATLGTVFATDILKSLAAHSIKRILTPALMKWVHYLMGIALVICGIVLLWEAYFHKGLSAA